MESPCVSGLQGPASLGCRALGKGGLSVLQHKGYPLQRDILESSPLPRAGQPSGCDTSHPLSLPTLVFLSAFRPGAAKLSYFRSKEGQKPRWPMPLPA